MGRACLKSRKLFAFGLDHVLETMACGGRRKIPFLASLLVV